MKRTKGRRGKGPARQKKRKPAARKKPTLRQPAKPYEFLDHPADVGFRARGKTLPELFSTAALAVCDCGWELDAVGTSESITVRAWAATREDLLFSWLSEVLFLTDAEGWVFKSFLVDLVEQAPAPRTAAGREGRLLWKVQGEARGERFDKNRHRTRTYIKAVTYHQLSVKETKAGWQATVYLDV